MTHGAHDTGDADDAASPGLAARARAWSRRDPWLAGLSAAAGVCAVVAGVLVAQLVASGWSEPTPSSSGVPRLPVLGTDLEPTEPLRLGPTRPDATGVLTGIVRDQDGRPVAGLDVELLGGPEFSVEPPLQSDRTDRQGRYRFERVGARRHTLRFIDTLIQGRFPEQYHGGVFDLSAAQLLRVSPRQTVRVPVVLEAGVRVTGTVRSTSGGPVDAYAIPERRTPTGWVQVSGVSGPQEGVGRFDRRGLPSGTYRLLIGSLNRGRLYAGPGGAEAAGKREAPTFEVGSGSTARVDAVLGEPGRMVGRVVTPGGRPVPGATVRLAEDAEPVGPPVGSCCVWYPQGYEDRTAADGTFAVVPANLDYRHLLDVSPPRGTLWQACGIDLREAGGAIDLEPGEVLERELVLAPGGSVRGVVTDQDGAPVAHAQVVAVPVKGAPCQREVTVRSDRQGRYRLAGLADQQYRLRVEHRRHATTWIGGGGRRAEARVVRVRPGRTVGGLDARLEAVARISGTVSVRSSGRAGPAPSVEVCLDDGAADPHRSSDSCVIADEDGGFVLEGVRPGSRLLRLRNLPFHSADQQQSWAYLDAEGVITYDRGQAARLEVTPGEDVTDVDVALDASASISGVTVSRLGTEREWEHLALLRRDVDGSWSQVARTQSVEDGVFELEGLPAGFYRFASVRGEEGSEELVPLPTGPSLLGMWVGPGESLEDVEVQPASP